MAVVTTSFTRYSIGDAHGHGGAGTPKKILARVEVGSADSATSTYDLPEIPSNARMCSGRVRWDDLASSGSPTLDFGLKSGTGNTVSITADADALSNGHDAATVNAGAGLSLVQIDFVGTPAWDLINGLTADPQGTLTPYMSLLDADVNAGGTVTVEIEYLLD